MATGDGIYARPHFFCRSTEHQFDIMDSVAIVFVSCIPSDMCVSVRLACRLAMSSCRASRLVRSAASCRPSARSVRRSARRLVWRRFVLLFARSRFVCRGGFALRSRAVSFLPWRPVCPSSRLSSCRSVSLAVSSWSSRFCPVISFSLARGLFVFVFIPVPVFAPFHAARRSFMFVNQSRFLCLCVVVGAGDASWGRAWVCSSRLITRSLRIGMRGGWGYEAPFHAARRSFVAIHAPSFFSSHQSLLVPPSRCVPHRLAHKASKKRRMTNDEGKWKREKRDARARWIEQDARRDEAAAEIRRRTSKQMRCLDETGKRDEKRDAPLTKSERQTTTMVMEWMKPCRSF